MTYSVQWRNWIWPVLSWAAQDKYMAPSWGTSWEMKLLSHFSLGTLLRAFFVSTLSQNLPFTTLRIWGSWNLSILASSPSSIRPFSNFWLSLRPSSVPFYQEWSLTEYSVPSVIWMYLIHRGFGLPEYVSPITHVTYLNFHHLSIQMFRINFSPSKVTVVYLLGFFLFLSMSFGSLQFSKPLFLTKTWNSYNVEILNCSITSLSIVFLLVCKPGLSHRWQSSESLLRSLKGLNSNKVVKVLNLTCQVPKL